MPKGVNAALKAKALKFGLRTTALVQGN